MYLRRSSSHLVDGTEINLFRVYIDFGARWVLLPEEEGEPQESGPEIKALIEATFLAEYAMKDEPGQDALNSFALRNASYHVWPYGREYLTNQGVRMNLPKVLLPTVQFAANHKDVAERSPGMRGENTSELK